MSAAPTAGARPLVLLCECAGTMPNLDFPRLAAELDGEAEVRRDGYWCGRRGQAVIRELAAAAPGRRIVLAGCGRDFAARRFRRLLDRGVRLEVADIREGCSWVHPVDDADAVTDKAARILRAAVRWPEPADDRLAFGRRRQEVVVIGGGVAGTQAAVELAQMGHPVHLVERRPFLGGRAARIGTVFPTNDCGQCLPATEAQPGTRKCFHRNLALDHPNLTVWRRATVEAVEGRPGDFTVTIRQLPNVVTDACVNCGRCEEVCPVEASEPGRRAIFSELYDGRVVRTVDLETCTFCGRCAAACPVEAIDFTQSPRRVKVAAGALLAAVGCEPARRQHFEYLGYGKPGVITQVELAERLDEWEALAALGRLPARHVVMVQCAGSRDRRHLPHCSRLCCMIALKHAIRLRTLFPEMKVTICYLEMRTAGVGYENWFLAARQAGVEFLRGTPPEVQTDGRGRPVVEVEDVTAARKRVLRPDLVVLSTGMEPAAGIEELADRLGVQRDVDGFIDILDRKNRATETSVEGVFVCGSASGPKALIEVTTEASAVATEIHAFLASRGRRTTAPSEVDPGRCVGCDTCLRLCPFGAVALAPRPQDAPRPEGVAAASLLATIDPGHCRACGICAATCPELAIRHNVSDEEILGRLAVLTDGVEAPVVGFYCRECAGAAIGLSGQRRDRYPANVRLIELPCVGRLSAVHLVEAARRGAAGVFVAGCAEGRCQYRRGDESAAEQMRLAREALAAAGRAVPMELWHLCAADRAGVGRRIRLFVARALGDSETLAALEREATLVDGGANGCAGCPAAAAGPTAGEATAAADGRGPDRAREGGERCGCRA